MQISTSLFYDRSTSYMASLNERADTLQTQLSTTKRLNNPSDDVVAYQRLQSYARATANDGAYSTNIGLSQTLLQQSDSTLANVQSQVQRAQELAIQANSDTLSDTDRQAIAVQLRSLVDDLAALANTKDARGQPLFGGADGDAAVTRNTDGTVSFAAGNPSTIPVGDGVSVQPTESAARIFGGVPTTDGGTSDVLTIISKLADALEAGGSVTEAAGAAIGDLKTSFDQINGARASLGARAARLDLQADRLKDAGADREISRSALEDTDITATITELQKTMTVLQATQASFTKLSSLSLFDYLQ